uniref:Uncharacterized protein n=1 Tax=Oryza sativa subsp. japonica TaxID=39947 RepID=Q69IK8_ORYSJ|nr:hypothetical protein [Oryza sativa Japonica Group]
MAQGASSPSSVAGEGGRRRRSRSRGGRRRRGARRRACSAGKGGGGLAAQRGKGVDGAAGLALGGWGQHRRPGAQRRGGRRRPATPLASHRQSSPLGRGGIGYWIGARLRVRDLGFLCFMGHWAKQFLMGSGTHDFHRLDKPTEQLAS